MRDDPIVAEVRRTREELAARFNFDVDAPYALSWWRKRIWRVPMKLHKAPVV